MKKTTLLYIPLVLLFLFAITVLVIHSFGMREVVRELFETTEKARSPFITAEKTIVELRPEAASAGLLPKDEIIAVNGKPLSTNFERGDELDGATIGETIRFTIERRSGAGKTEQKEIPVVLNRVERNAEYYGRVIVGIMFATLLPAFCLLLGFWVVFIRPKDFQAWLLLFLLLGLGSIGLEGDTNIWVKTFRNVFSSQWSLSMFLFGIYFPERWVVDKKFPWAKWIFIAPLGVQILDTLIEATTALFGFDYENPIFRHIPKELANIWNVLNIVAIGCFFSALGTKSGMLENKDSRRRLRLLLVGTTVAMTPSLIIVMMGILRGQTGFFNIVPSWFALIALSLLLLFPLTLAYVIVIERAMDVSVVIRQGLQYALAKNTIVVSQLLIPILALLAIVPFISKLPLILQIILLFILLAITALFSGVALKARLWIDRHFFREAYNAEQILSDLSEEVRTVVETKPLLETVSNKIAVSLHVPQVAFLLNNGINFRPAYALGFADSSPAVAFDEKTVTIDKLRKNEAVTVYADDTDSWVNTENLDDERDSLEKLNSQLLLPVGVKEKLLGFLSLSPKKSEEPYTANDLRLLKSVAAQTGLALENSRLTEAIVSETALRERLNREVEIAREVQERLFPQDLPKVKGLDYWGACRPALGVGGDYYDFFELENGKFGIAIGDVSGKGIGASLMMASLQATLRGQAIHFDEDLATLMCNVNRLVYETSTSNRYATFFYSQFDPKTCRLTYVNAGHNAPFLFRRTEGEDHELLRLETGGAVVGMLPPALISYEQGEIEMQPGDLLIGFTDGISEAMNPADEEWGEEQMIAAVRAKIDLTAREMLDYLVVCADNFASGAKQHDDMTAIIVRLINE